MKRFTAPICKTVKRYNKFISCHIHRDQSLLHKEPTKWKLLGHLGSHTKKLKINKRAKCVTKKYSIGGIHMTNKNEARVKGTIFFKMLLGSNIHNSC